MRMVALAITLLLAGCIQGDPAGSSASSSHPAAKALPATETWYHENNGRGLILKRAPGHTYLRGFEPAATKLTVGPYTANNVTEGFPAQATIRGTIQYTCTTPGQVTLTMDLSANGTLVASGSTTQLYASVNLLVVVGEIAEATLDLQVQAGAPAGSTLTSTITIEGCSLYSWGEGDWGTWVTITRP